MAASYSTARPHTKLLTVPLGKLYDYDIILLDLNLPDVHGYDVLKKLRVARVRGELLNETLFLSMAHARVEIAAWVDDYNRERPLSALGYATPAAFAAEPNKQWPASPRPTGSATQPFASTALMRNNTARLPSQLGESWGSHHTEHTSMSARFVSTIGTVRAKVKIGTQSLAYNMRRLVVLEGAAIAATRCQRRK